MCVEVKNLQLIRRHTKIELKLNIKLTHGVAKVYLSYDEYDGGVANHDGMV